MKTNQTAKPTRPSQPTTGQASLKSTSPPPPPPPTHTPSVPISVYRDLADELKAVNHHVNLLSSQNEALRQQNQTLRAEVVRVIESATKLQHILNTTPTSRLPSSSPSSWVPPVAPLTDNPESRLAIQPLSPQNTASPHLSTPTNQIPSSQTPSSQIPDAIIAELDQTLMAQFGTPQSTPPQAPPPPMAKTAPMPITDGAVGRQPFTKIDGPYCDLTISGLGQSDSRAEPGSEPEPETQSSEGSQPLDPQLDWQAIETELFTEQSAELLTSAPSLGGDLDSDKAKPINGLWLTLTLVVVIVTAFSAGFLVVLPFIQVDSD
ncbi:MAG: hypothetical protein AB4042_16405 [Leptolyngbyaceae cyanobacterium]